MYNVLVQYYSSRTLVSAWLLAPSSSFKTPSLLSSWDVDACACWHPGGRAAVAFGSSPFAFTSLSLLRERRMRPGAARLLWARREHLSCGVFLGRPGRFFSPGRDLCSCGRVFVSEFDALRCAARAFNVTRRDRRRHCCCCGVAVDWFSCKVGVFGAGVFGVGSRLLLASRAGLRWRHRHRRMLLLHLCKQTAFALLCWVDCSKADSSASHN